MRRASSSPPLATGTPATMALPLVGRPRPVRSRSVVVLPAPFGPRKPKTEPLGTVRSSASRAMTSPYRLLSPRTSMAGAQAHLRTAAASEAGCQRSRDAGHVGQAVASSRPTMK